MAADGREIERLVREEDWEGAERLLREELEREPGNHWLWCRLSLAFYERRRYAEALECSEKALSLAPRCPLALWEHAGDLDMLGREAEAAAIWRGLLRRGVRRIAYGECGEGRAWAESLLNDCRFRIARAAFEKGDFPAAARWIRLHLGHRKRGLPSCHSRAEALRLQRRIAEG